MKKIIQTKNQENTAKQITLGGRKKSIQINERLIKYTIITAKRQTQSIKPRIIFFERPLPVSVSKRGERENTDKLHRE